MRKNILLPAVYFILIIITGCSSGYENAPFSFGVGQYQFSMLDSAGNKLADGTLNVKNYSNNQFSGSYKFKNIYKANFSGLSAMSGEFSGEINKTDKKVFINTNPKIADSNVFWNLIVKNNSLSGDWTFSQFNGISNRGRIKITK